jgi:uncharacterized membrane protein (GlpM family)
MEFLLLIKFLVAIAMVLGMTLLAEYSSPRLAGIISGYPTGSAISLFFFGIEQGRQFAAESAVYNIRGLTAMLVFIVIYWLVSRSIKRYSVIPASLAAIAGYALAVFLLMQVGAGKLFSVLIPALASIMAIIIFRNLQNTRITRKIPAKASVLLFRALFASVIIVLITILPRYVGPEWAGLFSAFPSTLFPLILIIHISYDKSYAYTIIKNVPIGLFSLILYSLTVSIAYPLYGIWLGTLAAYLAATLWLVLFFALKNKFIRMLNKQILKQIVPLSLN